MGLGILATRFGMPAIVGELRHSIFDGATTTHRTPAASSARAGPKPVGPAS